MNFINHFNWTGPSKKKNLKFSDILKKCFRFVEGEGPEGISQQELGRRLGHGKLEARTICRYNGGWDIGGRTT